MNSLKSEIPQDLQDFIESLKQANYSPDFNVFKPLIHPNAVFSGSGRVFRGREEIQKDYESAKDHVQTIKLEYPWFEWVVITDQSASFIFRFDWRGKIEGRDTRLMGINSDVAVKEVRWQLVSSFHSFVSEENA